MGVSYLVSLVITAQEVTGLNPVKGQKIFPRTKKYLLIFFYIFVSKLN